MHSLLLLLLLLRCSVLSLTVQALPWCGESAAWLILAPVMEPPLSGIYLTKFRSFWQNARNPPPQALSS